MPRSAFGYVASQVWACTDQMAAASPGAAARIHVRSLDDATPLSLGRHLGTGANRYTRLQDGL